MADPCATAAGAGWHSVDPVTEPTLPSLLPSPGWEPVEKMLAEVGFDPETSHIQRKALANLRSFVSHSYATTKSGYDRLPRKNNPQTLVRHLWTDPIL